MLPLYVAPLVWKWFPDDNWLCNQPMIMKLHTLTHHESRMRPIDFEVKGQGHGAWLFENGFRTITDSVINLWSWNFIHLLPMSQGCALLILGSKGQRSRSWRMVIWKWSTEIMVADLNLLGSVGDLYCFSNTFSMLLYVAPICCPSCSFCILNASLGSIHVVICKPETCMLCSTKLKISKLYCSSEENNPFCHTKRTFVGKEKVHICITNQQGAEGKSKYYVNMGLTILYKEFIHSTDTRLRNQ